MRRCEDPRFNQLSYSQIFSRSLQCRHDFYPSLTHEELCRLTEELFDAESPKDWPRILREFRTTPDMTLRIQARKILDWLKKERKDIDT